jgi:hypothetical protein
MTIGFKQFIAEDNANAKHTLKFMTYKQHQHRVIADKFRESLGDEWKKIAKKFKPIEPTEAVDKNWTPEAKKSGAPKKGTSIDFVSDESQIGKTSHRKKVRPYVKIGTGYPKDERLRCQRELIEVAKSQLTKLAKKLNDGTDSPFFIEKNDDDEMHGVRFMFKTGDIHEFIFIIGVDHGASVDKVYLRDLISHQ